jgi:hypothetical protein
VKRLNLLLSLSSLNLLLITAERFSFTTRVLLRPDNFLRLHELIQMSVLILISVLIPCFILYTLTSELATLRQRRGKVLTVIFLAGMYFYATGNGVHETSSFLWNEYCPQNNLDSPLCKSMYFNDYYTGNILYFIGAFMTTVTLVALEKMLPNPTFTRGDYALLSINSFLYTFAIIAYAAFDRVAVGLVYVLITTVVVDGLLFLPRTAYARFPFSIYTAMAYTAGTVLSLIIRLVR